ncbi:MAG TPA: hypothetical protein ENG87_02260 [Candidatus Pacearchaeota archaeon]|nr:hypothetical protein BMS3Abin17_00372 [archaeon BMS3Abin17]HDK42178.1 hypothetical protein [Candidatus Pacearchaeota archaeon]HDZ60239.1 hypothetical protein [Candidatus Pacearchaeota archaeon]
MSVDEKTTEIDGRYRNMKSGTESEHPLKLFLDTNDGFMIEVHYLFNYEYVGQLKDYFRDGDKIKVKIEGEFNKDKHEYKGVGLINKIIK